MRRIVSLLVLAGLAAVLHLVVPAPATAARLTAPDPIVGQLVDSSTDFGVGDVHLQLRSDDGGVPGAVVASDFSEANGEFSLAPPSADVSYWVEVVRDRRVQGGYVSDQPDGPSWVQTDVTYAAPVAPGTHLGRVLDNPSFISGIVVNAANGNRVGGIVVSVREATSLSTSVGHDTTDSAGFFRIPIFGEDYGLWFNGTARDYERGWLSCAKTVVRPWGAACGSPLGRVGKVKIDHL